MLYLSADGSNVERRKGICDVLTYCSWKLLQGVWTDFFFISFVFFFLFFFSCPVDQALEIYRVPGFQVDGWPQSVARSLAIFHQFFGQECFFIFYCLPCTSCGICNFFTTFHQTNKKKIHVALSSVDISFPVFIFAVFQVPRKSLYDDSAFWGRFLF